MLTTTILRDHRQWIEGHVVTGKDGRLRCAATEGEILSRVHHFYRLGSQGPYVPEKSLPPISDSVRGSMVSFVTFSCKACDSRLETPSQIYSHNLMQYEKR